LKTASQIWIDRHIAGNIARLMNLAVIPLGKILNIDHSLQKNFTRIAVCKYKGMGSIIQSMPLVRSLRKNYPEARITYISTVSNKGILKEIKDVDEMVVLDDRSFFRLVINIIPFVFRLLSRRFEVYIDLEVYSNFSTLITILSKAKNRMGFYLNSMSYRMGNYTHMMYYNTRSPISETYLQFARLLECKTIQTEIPGLSSEIKKVNTRDGMTLEIENEKLIVINPNASELRIERRWDGLKYASLAERLQDEFPEYKILFIGAPSESNYVDWVMSQIKNKNAVYSVAGTTNIKELIALISGAELFISNDSGPMHIAFSTGTSVLALFGPCSPEQYGMNENCKLIYAHLYCSPCVHEFVAPPCKGNNYCMKVIETETVFEAATSMLTGRPMPEKHDSSMIFKLGEKFNNFTIGTFARADK